MQTRRDVHTGTCVDAVSVSHQAHAQGVGNLYLPRNLSSALHLAPATSSDPRRGPRELSFALLQFSPEISRVGLGGVPPPPPPTPGSWSS